MKYFMKDVKKYGVVYAFGYKLWCMLDSLFWYKLIDRTIVRKRIEKLANRVETFLNQYDGHLVPSEDYNNCEEVRISTPCSCTIFNDCTECGSYPMCAQFDHDITG